MKTIQTSIIVLAGMAIFAISASAQHNGLPNGMSNGQPNGMSNGVPNGTSNGSPNGMSNGIPNGTKKSDRVSKISIPARPTPRRITVSEEDRYGYGSSDTLRNNICLVPGARRCVQ